MTSHMSMNFQGAARIKEVLEAPALSSLPSPATRDRRIDFSVSFAYEEEDAVWTRPLMSDREQSPLSWERPERGKQPPPFWRPDFTIPGGGSCV